LTIWWLLVAAAADQEMELEVVELVDLEQAQHFL
jgi:hypothetical protein